MNKITKKNFAKEERNIDARTVIAFLLGSAFFIFELWLVFDNKTVYYVSLAVIAAVICIVFSVLLYFEKIFKNFPEPYYIVEDVFIGVKKDVLFDPSRPDITYTLKFSKSGKFVYEIPRFKDSKKEPKRLQANYSAIHYSKPGDKFFLVISNHNGEIIKCYNQNYFKLCREDFVLLNGKYYAKDEKAFNF